MAGFHTGTANLHLPGLHPFLPRNETNAVMSQYLGEDGWFLLRPSFTNEGLFSICVTFQGGVKHFKILLDPVTQQYYVSSRRFPTIMDLLSSYKEVPLKSKNCQVYLLRDIPVDRERERLHMIHQGIEPPPSRQSSNQIQNRPLPTVPGQSTTKSLPRSRPLPSVPPQTMQKDTMIDRGRRGTWTSDSDRSAPKTLANQRGKEKPQLPAGWTEHFSQQHKRPYYYNAKTKETTWKRPRPHEDPNYVTMQKSLQQMPIPNGQPPIIPPRQTTSETQIPVTDESAPPVPRRNRPSLQHHKPEATSPSQRPAYEEMKPVSFTGQPRKKSIPKIGSRSFSSEPTRPADILAKANTAPPPLPNRLDSSPKNIHRDTRSLEGQNSPAPAHIHGRDLPPPLPNRQESGNLTPTSKGTRDALPLPPNRDAPPPIPGREDIPYRRVPLPPREENVLPPVPSRGENVLPAIPGGGEQAPPPIPSRTSQPSLPKRAVPAAAAPLPARDETRYVAQLPVRQGSIKSITFHEYENNKQLSHSSSFHDYTNNKELPPLPVKDDDPVESHAERPAFSPPPPVSTSRYVTAVPPAPPLPPTTPTTPSSAIVPPPPPPPMAPPPIDEVPPSPRPSKQQFPVKNAPPSLPHRDNSNLLDEIKAFGGGATGRLRSASERAPSLTDSQTAQVASEGDIISALKNKLMMVHAAACQDESDEEFEQVEDDDDWS